MCSIRPHRRRAAVYVAVLTIAMLVCIMGLSAITAARIRRQSQNLNQDADRARFLAISAIDIGMWFIQNSSTWRTDFPHDTWSNGMTLRDGTLSYKVVDETDGNLADSSQDPVRLYGRALVGDTRRMYSVLLRPTNQTPSYDDETNLLHNPGMETGTSHWTGQGYCDLESKTDDPHGGTAYLRVKNRDYAWAGPSQSVTDQLDYGVTYYSEVWVRTKDAPESMKLTLRITDALGTKWYTVTEATVQTTWTKLSGTVQPTWFLTLYEARWRVEATSSTQDIHVDDVVLRKGTGPGSEDPEKLIPVPGSWRQETVD